MISVNPIDRSQMRSEGRIVEWRDEAGFGFAECPGITRRVFVHVNSFARRGQRRPSVGDLIAFDLQHDDRGRPQAAWVSYIGGSPAAPAFDLGGLASAAFIASAFCVLLATAILLGCAPEWIVAPYVVLGLLSASLYRLDKEAAMASRWRVRERDLLIVDFLGGWVGGLFGRLALRHKTRKLSYVVSFWATAGAHCVFWSLFILDRLST